jgi:RNA polymerase sigma factor (sigma-70 family)
VEDSEILRASLEDPEQFEAIFDRHHGVIWRYLARLGGRDRADDLAGEVFVVAFAIRDRYEPGRGSVRAWLYGIASNVVRTRLRSDGRQARAVRRLAWSDGTGVAATEAIDDRLVHEARLAAVLSAFPRLSTMDREVIALFVFEELSYQEISAALGVEVGTVRSRLARARAHLRELAGLSGEVSDDLR